MEFIKNVIKKVWPVELSQTCGVQFWGIPARYHLSFNSVFRTIQEAML